MTVVHRSPGAAKFRKWVIGQLIRSRHETEKKNAHAYTNVQVGQLIISSTKHSIDCPTGRFELERLDGA
uniref:Uncharacterized protein n=1 Tax=Populus trichocarpa TaxID=3694 RepID=A0A2K1WTM3_POPTR